MATFYPIPSPIPADPPFTLDVHYLNEFAVGKPEDKEGLLNLTPPPIRYDLLENIDVLVDTTDPAHSLATGAGSILWQLHYNPASAYVVGVMLYCSVGEAFIQLGTDIDVPNSSIPIPLSDDSWFMYFDDHPYELVQWGGAPNIPAAIRGITIETWEPSRIFGYVFLKFVRP